MALHLLTRHAIVLTGLALLATIACAKPATSANPALPDGFKDAKAPDIAAVGYVYVKQSGPTVIKAGAVPGVTADLSVQAIQVLLGADPKDTAVAATFASASEAGAAKGFVLAKDAPVEPAVSGNMLAFGQGNAQWTASAVAGLRDGGSIPVSTKFTVAHDLLKYFPEKGPGTPAAVALLHLDGSYLASMKGRSDMAALQDALSKAKIGDIAAVVYVEQPLVIDQDLFGNKGTGGNSHPAAIIVGQTGYASWAVGGLFNTIASAAGLKETQGGGKKVYRYGAEDAPLKVLVANKGNLLYIAVAEDQSRVEKAILSVVR